MVEVKPKAQNTKRPAGRVRVHQVRSGSVEVIGAGVTADDVAEAMGLLTIWRDAQVKAEAGFAQSVVTVLMEGAGPILSPTRSAAAERIAQHRVELLGTPTYTHETLAEARGAKGAAVRAWVARHRRAGDVVVVKQDGRTLLPAFQFTAGGELRPEVARVNRILYEDTEMTGWEKWTWWWASTGLLSGQSPIDVIESAPVRVETAARRFIEPDAF